MQKENMSMTTLTEYQVNPENVNSEEWHSNWRSQALAAPDEESQTWARETAVSDEDNSCVMIYGHRSNGNGTNDPDPLQFDAVQLTMHISLLNIDGFGWWSRDLEIPQRRQLNLSLTGLRFPNEQHKDGFLEHSQKHADYCWDAEPDTLVYGAGIVAHCIEGDLDLEPGDLVFIMGCTDESAVEKHLNDPKHIALGYQLYDAGVELKQTFSKSYRTTGDGFFFVPAT